MIRVGVWKTSTLTDNSGPWCVEVAGGEGLKEILVRDTKAGPDAPIQRYSREEWLCFIGGVKNGEFDLD
jgi:hypothetical protein